MTSSYYKKYYLVRQKQYKYFNTKKYSYVKITRLLFPSVHIEKLKIPSDYVVLKLTS